MLTGVMYHTHGKERTGGKVAKYCRPRAKTLPGVYFIEANREAVRQDARQIDHELSTSYPGRRDSSIYEERRASWIMSKLGKLGLLHSGITLDIHDTPTRNSNFVAVGDKVHPMMLGVALSLGIRSVIRISNIPFFAAVQRGMMVETTLDPANNPLSQPAYWYSCLAKLSQTSEESLSLQYFTEVSDMRYFGNYREVSAEEANQFGLYDVHPRQENAFSKLPLPGEPALAWGLEKEQVYAISWNHNNSSTLGPDGRPSLFAQITTTAEAPRLGVDGWLYWATQR